jgi:hypothetical protein
MSILDTFDEANSLYARNLYRALQASSNVADTVSYDGNHTIVVEKAHAYGTRNIRIHVAVLVDITFPNPFGKGTLRVHVDQFDRMSVLVNYIEHLLSVTASGTAGGTR